MPKAGRILVFDSHPIQYRSPVFSEIYKRHPNFKVYYFDESFDGSRWWFHEVGKIPKQAWNLDLKSGFPNEVLFSSHWGGLSAWRNFRKILQAEKPASVLIYGYYLKEHWILRFLCRRLGIPLSFVGETFENRAKGLRSWLKAPLRRFFFRGVTEFLAVGKKTRRFYEDLGIDHAKIITANYCTDSSFFELSPRQSVETRQRIRNSLNISEKDVILLFVGRLFERKRPMDMLALHERLEKNPHIHTVIVGNGPLEERIHERSQLFERVHLVGFKDQRETRDFYHAADLLVVPSEYETWGLVVNEAAAAGLPSMVTENCGVAGDLVVHGETGFIIPVGDLRMATGLVERLIEENTLRKQMSENVRAKIAHYSCEKFGEVFLTRV